MENQSFETASSTTMLVLPVWKVDPKLDKWLFVLDAYSDEGVPYPELVVFLATEEKMHEYLSKLRAKGWQVAAYNVSAIEDDPYVTISDLLKD